MIVFGLAGFACNRPTHAASDLPLPDETLPVVKAEEGQSPQASVVIAGGCFWCTEAVFEQLQGVSAVVSGYAGGKADHANYQAVSAGATDHAEVIRVDYNPDVIGFGEILRVFFGVAHDPTQLNRQGPDAGKQYRSAVFYADEDQERIAGDYIKKLDEAGIFDKPIATTIEPLDAFYEAEQYHQDYVVNNPDNPYIRFNALPKVEKLRKQYKGKVKGE